MVHCGGDIASFNFLARELRRQLVASDIASFNFLARELQLVASDIASFTFLVRELRLKFGKPLADHRAQGKAAVVVARLRGQEVKSSRGPEAMR